MPEPGANSEHPNGTAQRERQHGCVVEGGIMVGAVMGVVVLTVAPFGSLLSLHAPPQRQLAYGLAAYVLAIVAALLAGWVRNLPEGLPKLVLFSLIIGIVVGPAGYGSFCIASAIAQFAGWQLGANANLGVLIVLLLWAVLVFGIVFQVARVTAWVIERRTRLDG